MLSCYKYVAVLIQKVIPIVAGTLSLIAQGILLIPTALGILLRSLNKWGSTSAGAVLFVLAIFLFIFVIGPQFAKHPGNGA